MTNHIPYDDETYVQHIGKKKKTFVIKNWGEKRKRIEELKRK